MTKGFEQLQIDEEFKTLIRPLRKEEYDQLEINIAADGCREPITVWNGTIIDGHNRYEICNRRRIPYGVREVYFASREEAIIWICSNQLGRRNISEENRRYLIGKQYELAKMIGKNLNPTGINQYSIGKGGGRNKKITFRRTAQKIGEQYHVSTGTVQKYALFSKAIDSLNKKSPDLSQKILTGSYKLAHESVIALSKMDPEEIEEVTVKQEDTGHSYVRYSDSRKSFMPTEEEQEPPQEHLPSIKITPTYDPDAELTGLALTVPTWVSSIERARTHSNFAEVSPAAKGRLEEALVSLQDEISEMIQDIREVE